MPDRSYITISRYQYPVYNRDFFEDNRNFLILAIVIFLTALSARSWQNMLHPGLYMEDATHYFNIYYGGRRNLSFILQHPNGYYNILNNLVALIVSRFDVRIQPLLYHLFSFGMGIATASCFLFTGLIRNRLLLIAVPLVLGLSGMNHIFYYNSLTFQMYNVVILLLALLFLPIPQSTITLVIISALSALLIWSGPYSVVALPVSLLFLLFFKNGKKTYLYLWVTVNVILYSLSVRESTIRVYNIIDAGTRRLATDVLVIKIFFLDLFSKVSSLHIALLLTALMAALYILRKNTFYLRLSIILLAVTIGALAPLFLSIKLPLYGTVFPCHIYISLYFWLFFVLFTADKLLEKIQPRLSIQYGTLVFFIFLVIIDNTQHPDKGSEPIMDTIPAFVETIYQVEQLNLEEKSQYVIVETENMIPGYMPPKVRVGSPKADARRIKGKDLQISSGKNFIVN